MNKRRLLKLADLLEADAKNKKGIQFDLGTWGQGDEKPGVNCGTMACAMGLAALSGAFRHAGLGKRVIRLGETSWEMAVTYKGRAGCDAAAHLFDVSYEEAGFLFYPSSYSMTPRGSQGERLVAKRIRDFVSGKVAA